MLPGSPFGWPSGEADYGTTIVIDVGMPLYSALREGD